MSSKKPTKTTPKRPTKRTNKRTVKEAKFVEHMAAGESGGPAVNKSGWRQTPAAARVTASRLMADPVIAERVALRKTELLKRAGITTEEIVGSIAEIAMSSLADVNPDDKFLQQAKANGVDHIIKKVKVFYDRQGNVTAREYENYSRLDALDKLLDVRGARKQAAANPRDVARHALLDMRARFPELSEEAAKQIIAETFDVQTSELVN